MEPIRMDYGSPRWTKEMPDCSMPMTFDTYSTCSFNCLYCFAFYQKEHTLDGYQQVARSVDPGKVKRLFLNALSNNPKGTKLEKQFYPYIQNRRIMQWGGLSDEFDEYERRYGKTLELLHFFDEIDYPLSFSTKSTWWTKDKRYMDIFARHAHNWHVKISIITADREKARKMEIGVPPPEERLAAIKRLSDIGIHVTLRLRPFIIGVSKDWKELIKKAKEAGADSVTTEFFCLDSRADARTKERYQMMSKIMGFDVLKFYVKNSEQQGYKRLNRRIKAPIIYAMRVYAHSLGLRFHVSDAYCRECNDEVNCCGVPPEWGNSYTGHFGKAILIARKNGEVHWSDIEEEADKILGGFDIIKAGGYNTSNNLSRARLANTSAKEFLHSLWNNPKKGDSPARAYGHTLIPAGVDKKGDIVYRYGLKREPEKRKE